MTPQRLVITRGQETVWVTKQRLVIERPGESRGETGLHLIPSAADWWSSPSWIYWQVAVSFSAMWASVWCCATDLLEDFGCWRVEELLRKKLAYVLSRAAEALACPAGGFVFLWKCVFLWAVFSWALRRHVSQQVGTTTQQVWLDLLLQALTSIVVYWCNFCEDLL